MNELVLAPSILAADYTKLGSQIAESVHGGAQWIHCDIMDGHFVPNISYGPMIVEAANRATDAFLDVHLMIYNPDSYVDAFIEAGADLISVHCEATPHIHRSLQNIRSKGVSCGAVLNPGSALDMLYPVLEHVDLILLMSVNPGFGGQKFIPQTLPRLEKIANLRAQNGLSFRIEVDGGVGLDNIRDIAQAGADTIVAGSSVFGADDIAARVQLLLQKASS